MTLQVSGVCEGKGLHEWFMEFSFAKGVTCEYAIASDILFVGALVFSAVAMFTYIRTGSPIMPIGLIMITGGATLAFVPATPLRWAVALILIGGAGVFGYVWYRYNR